MIFNIKKNSHWSNKLFYKLLNFFNYDERLSYIVKFNSSCLYHIETVDKYDINKLFGFSSGFNHHKNSARFGWNSVNDKILLFAYCYVNGKRVSEFIKDISIDEEYKMIILDKKSHYLFTLISSNDIITQTKIEKPKDFKVGYKLWPYFGGNLKAPQNISIEFNKN